MITPSNGNIFRATGPLCGEFDGHRHICVSKLTIIGSDNGLSPGWRQAIIWTYAELLSKLRNKFLWFFLFWNAYIFIQENAFEKCHLQNGVSFVSASVSLIMTHSSHEQIACCISTVDSRFVPRQWETSLQSNATSHRLCTNLESALLSHV